MKILLYLFAFNCFSNVDLFENYQVTFDPESISLSHEHFKNRIHFFEFSFTNGEQNLIFPMSDLKTSIKPYQEAFYEDLNEVFPMNTNEMTIPRVLIAFYGALLLGQTYSPGLLPDFLLNFDPNYILYLEAVAIASISAFNMIKSLKYYFTKLKLKAISFIFINEEGKEINKEIQLKKPKTISKIIQDTFISLKDNSFVKSLLKRDFQGILDSLTESELKKLEENLKNFNNQLEEGTGK